MVSIRSWSQCCRAAGIAALFLIHVSAAQAQLANLHEDGKDLDAPGGSSGNSLFCDGNRCPGQTCDPVNLRCVGNVTLQPGVGQPLVGLQTAQRERFEAGKVLFGEERVVATGLGPVFNQRSCGACHNTPLGGSGTITVTRFGVLDFDDFSFDPLADLGGSLLNKESISPECKEEIPVPPTNIASFRVTNSTLGFGLVEGIPDVDLLFWANNPPGGVSGRALNVPILEDPPNTAVGRFGWKSQLATVLSFSADASLQEMGLTSRVLPEDNAPNNDQALLALCDTVPDPEDQPDDEGVDFIDRVTDFQRFLSQPPQTPRSGMAGEAIFESIGCADCHVSTFHTPNDANLEPALRNKEFHPYSDFLVHDMGFGADFIEQGGAGVFEIRTPPLWGMRIRDPLWHDGRVAGGSFAFRILTPGGIIDQHDSFGSEAQPSAQAFKNLSDADQDRVVDFLASLGRMEFDNDGDGLVDGSDAAAFNACYAQAGAVFSPDHSCAVSDVDQDGDVDDDDLALFEVALGLVVDDEDEDGDGGDDESDDGDDEFNDAEPEGFQQIWFGSPGMGTSTTSPQDADAPQAPEKEERQRQSRPKSTDSRKAGVRHRGL